MTRTMLYTLLAVLTLTLCLAAPAALADEKQEDPAKDKAAEKADSGEKTDDKKEEGKEDPKRKTYKVEAKPLKLEVTVSGDLVSREMTEIMLDAESWSKFEIEEIVPHGARVRVGETLVRFDPEDLNKALDDLELEQRISEIALIKAEQELPLLEEALERQLKNAERSWEEAKEDYARYTDKERDLILKSYDMRLKQSKFSLDYVKDELEQLEKMYEADDLTEETEEMILRRQKTQYEFAKFSYEIAKYNNALTLGTYLPRSDEDLKQSQRLVELALERAKMASELDLSRARYALEKARKDRREELEKHAEMVADKGLMTIKSPVAGVVYYGKCANGKWSEIASYKQKLAPEKSVPKGTVMMTIVDSSEVFLLGSLSEKDLPSVKEGQAAKVELTAEGVDPIDARIAHIDNVPTSTGKFEFEVELTGEAPEWLVPGMTGKALITTYEKKKALMVPKEAVHDDEQTDRKYVWEVEEEDGQVEVEKEWVKIGKTNDKEIEITEGIEAGDVISLDPKEQGTEEDGDTDDEEDEEDEDGDDEADEDEEDDEEGEDDEEEEEKHDDHDEEHDED